MSQTAVVPVSPGNSKKGIRKAVREKIAVSLADYRSLVGEKRFDRRIRKAARILGEEIIKAMPRKEKKKMKAVTE